MPRHKKGYPIITLVTKISSRPLKFLDIFPRIVEGYKCLRGLKNHGVSFADFQKE
jgi:hypothetical protein